MRVGGGPFLVALALAAPAARAQDFTVNSTADVVDVTVGDGLCSTGRLVASAPECTLRAAIQEANALAGPHRITVPAGTYLLTTPLVCPANDTASPSPQYCLLRDVSIVGAGAASTVLDAGGLDRVFVVAARVTARIEGVTIQNGRRTGGSPGGSGGGIANYGDLTVVNSVLNRNASQVEGGGIYSSSILLGAGLFSSGALHLYGTSFLNNSADAGGGVNVNYGKSLSVENCAFTGNSAQHGGGLFDWSTNATIIGSTFSQNTARFNTNGGLGGGLFATDGAQVNQANAPWTLRITSSTFAGNQADHGGETRPSQNLLVRTGGIKPACAASARRRLIVSASARVPT